jgi:hypothetical protein
MKKATLLHIFMTIMVLHSYSQNLVLNYSFENHNYTPCQIVDQFSDILVDWDSPNGQSGDVYFTTIAQDCYYYQPNSTYSGPIGFKGSELPSEGEVFAGIWVYTIDGLEQREYIRGQLSAPLSTGDTYRVKLNFSLADFMESSVSELGIAFVETTSIQTNGDLVLSAPQLIIHSGLEVSQGWASFDTSFVSDGNYEYFIIGNFKSDADTETKPNPGATAAPGTYGAYYFFDEISIEMEMPNSVAEAQQSMISIYPTIVHESLFINVTGKHISHYRIINQFGQIVKEDKLPPGKEALVDCSFLKPGIYYLSTYSNGLPASSYKFIKI